MRSYCQTLIILFAILLLLCGCGRVACNDRSVAIEYAGFDSADLSMLVVKRFEKGTELTKLSFMDTLNIANTNAFEEKNGFYYARNIVYLREHFDWELSIVNLNRVDRVSDIKNEKNHQYSGFGGIQDVCMNGISYSLNGTKQSRRKEYHDGASGSHPVVIQIRK